MECLVLLDSRGRKHLVTMDEGVVRVPDVGALDMAKLRAHLGRRLSVGGRSFLVLEPSPRDLQGTMVRGPQILAPKDVAVLLFEADVHPGAHVVEGGTGSGAMTIALAHAVGSSGRVASYDTREESLRLARRNVTRAGLTERVELLRGDVRSGITQRDVDAVLIDIPDPWAAVPAAWDALRPCGHLATFSPNMEQVKETVTAIRKNPFIDVRTVELIEREIEVREVGVRPSFAALGHTGYLTFARKVLDTF